MPDLSTAEKVRVWRARIERSAKIRDKWLKDIVEKNLEALYGQDKPDWWSHADPWINVGLVFSTMRATLPTLLYSHPKYSITPKRPEIIDGVDHSFGRAQGSELWLNHWWHEADGDKHARIAIQNAYIAVGVLKGGYRPHFADDEKRGVIREDGEGNWFIGPDGLPELERGEWLRDENNQVVFDSRGRPIPHPGEIQCEEFFLDAVDPRLMLFDPDGKEVFRHHRWVAEEWVRPVNDVREDPRFPRATRRRVKANEVAGKEREKNAARPWGRDQDRFKDVVDQDMGRVRGYDIYDFETGELLVLTKEPIADVQDDRFLLEDDIPPGQDHGPYRFLKFNEKPGEWYPTTEIEVMAPCAREYNIMRSQMMIHGEHAKARYAEADGAFYTENADEEREKLQSGPDQCVVKVDPNGIEPIKQAQLDGSFYARAPMVRADFQEVSGISSAQRGATRADTTATEVSVIKTESDVRNNDRRDNQVQSFLSEVGSLLLESGRANATGDTYVRIETPDAEAPWEFGVVDPGMLDVDSQVDIAIGSTMAKNDSRVAGQILMFMQAIAQNPHIAAAEGLMERALDSMNLDPHLARELREWAKQAVQAQQGGGAEGLTPTQQVLGEGLPNGIGNAAGGTPTGATIN